MSPPINLPDGTEVSEVILPDGATASEVVAPDGRTVFGGIPDSVVLQYFGDAYSTGDASWTDDNGVSDMSLTGDPQADTLSDSSDSIHFDSTDDYGETSLPASLEGSSLNAFSFETSVQYTANNEGNIIGAINGNNNQRIRLRVDRDDSFNTDNGNFNFVLTDENGNQFIFAPSSNPGIDDGSRHDISVIINDASQNNADIIIDGSTVSVSVNKNGGPSAFGGWDTNMTTNVENKNGSLSGFQGANIGAIRWHDTAISGQTISNY